MKVTVQMKIIKTFVYTTSKC